MSDPYIGEVKYFGFQFAPVGWGICNGAAIPVRQSMALFALLGIQFGGDGNQTFQLPNLTGRFPVGSGQGTGLSNRPIAAAFGEASVTLLTSNLPPHVHTAQGFSNIDVPNSSTPTATSAFSTCSDGATYTITQPSGSFHQATVSVEGDGSPHPNVQPALGLLPCIAMTGIFPMFD